MTGGLEASRPQGGTAMTEIENRGNIHLQVGPLSVPGRELAPGLPVRRAAGNDVRQRIGMEAETILILLFAVATAVAIAVQRLDIPYTVALVITVPRVRRRA
jgi:hypothetical protein